MTLKEARIMHEALAEHGAEIFSDMKDAWNTTKLECNGVCKMILEISDDGVSYTGAYKVGKSHRKLSTKIVDFSDEE